MVSTKKIIKSLGWFDTKIFSFPYISIVKAAQQTKSNWNRWLGEISNRRGLAFQKTTTSFFESKRSAHSDAIQQSQLCWRANQALLGRWDPASQFRQQNLSFDQDWNQNTTAYSHASTSFRISNWPRCEIYYLQLSRVGLVIACFHGQTRCFVSRPLLA